MNQTSFAPRHGAMRPFVLALILAMPVLVASPNAAIAHQGVLHKGCAFGQSFATGDLTVTGAFVRATPKGAQSAGGYLAVTNNGSAADVLMGASSEAATEISIHRMEMNGDVMKMSAVEGGLELPPGQTVALDPMGTHLMMTGMEQQFVEGQCVEIMLHFAKAGDLPLELNVGGVAQRTPPNGDGAAPAAEDAEDHDMSSMTTPSGIE